jgi:hypothetical protein
VSLEQTAKFEGRVFVQPPTVWSFFCWSDRWAVVLLCWFDSCVLIVQKDFNLNEGVFDMGSSLDFGARLDLYGNFTMNNGKFYCSCLHPKKNVTLNFKGVKDQIYNYIN